MADKDTCPIHDDGVHKHYLFKTFDTYEPFNLTFGDMTDEGLKKIEDLIIPTPLYEHVEYGVLSCKCGDVIKKRIREA